MPLTRAEVERIVQDAVTRRGAADRGMFEDAWRTVLRRIAGDLRMGSFEGVCRPLITEMIDAWSDLVPYLHMPSETMHPFFKPEGEEQVIGFLTRARETVASVRRVLAELPDMRDAAIRWNAIRHLEATAALLEGNVAIVHDICSRTNDPRKKSGEQYVGHLVIRTKEFRNLQQVYQELMAIVVGKEANTFFREQFELAEASLKGTVAICDIDPGGPVQ